MMDTLKAILTVFGIGVFIVAMYIAGAALGWFMAFLMIVGILFIILVFLGYCVYDAIHYFKNKKE